MHRFRPEVLFWLQVWSVILPLLCRTVPGTVHRVPSALPQFCRTQGLCLTPVLRTLSYEHCYAGLEGLILCAGVGAESGRERGLEDITGRADVVPAHPLHKFYLTRQE